MGCKAWAAKHFRQTLDSYHISSYCFIQDRCGKLQINHSCSAAHWNRPHVGFLRTLLHLHQNGSVVLGLQQFNKHWCSFKCEVRNKQFSLKRFFPNTSLTAVKFPDISRFSRIIQPLWPRYRECYFPFPPPSRWIITYAERYFPSVELWLVV